MVKQDKRNNDANQREANCHIVGSDKKIILIILWIIISYPVWNNIQIGYYNRENILRIFKLIDRVSPEVNIGRRRLISVNFILKQLKNRIHVYSSHSVKDYIKIL